MPETDQTQFLNAFARQMRPAFRDAGPDNEFEDFERMLQILTREAEFWQSAQAVPDFANTFETLKNSLNNALKSGRRDYLDQAQQVIKARDGKFIFSSSPRGAFLAALAKKRPSDTSGALAFLTGTIQPDNLRQSTYWSGVVAASLFLNPGAFSSAAAAQVATFDAERSTIRKFRKQIDADWGVLQAETAEWKAANQSTLDEFFRVTREAFQKKHEESAAQISDQKARFDSEYSTWEMRVTALELLYKDKLRLEQPAIYWERLQRSYSLQGYCWAAATAIATAVLARVVSNYVYIPPSIFNNDKFTLAGFKGAIAIAAGVSMLIYLINILARMWTSSFHLARDARERRQLTHVYLALAKDGAVSEKEREIVLTALFSRSDTGLLKHDASPELPLSAAFSAVRGRP